MRLFHDSDRNRWELKLTLGAAKRVFDETGDKKIAAATGTLGAKLRDLPDAQTVPVFES